MAGVDGFPPGGRPPVPPDVRAAEPDRERRDRIGPARADKGAAGDAGSAADDVAAREAAEVAVELTEAEGPADKARIARRMRAAASRTTSALTSAAANARRRASSATHGVTAGMNWLTAQVLAMGPRLRIRDQAALRAHFPGLTDDEIAKQLIDRAARAAAAVGGTTGAWAALPTLPAFPAEVAAETLAVVGIEIKLVAELHEVYGMGATGTGTERARSYIGSWASRRGIYQVEGGLLLVTGSPLARQLTRRLAARVRRSTFALAPLFTGALAGAMLNRRETRRLGQQIKDDLRQRRVARPMAKAAIISGAQPSYTSRGDDPQYPPRAGQ